MGGRLVMIRAYARVSAKQQDLSLQFDAFERAGADVIYQEGEGSAPARPELERLLSDLEEGDAVLVWAIDCLSSDGSELLGMIKTIEEAKATLSAVPAESKQEVLRERTVAGIAAARARGGSHGRPRALSETEEAEAREMLEWGESCAEIARIYGCSRPTISRLKKKRSE